MSTTIRGVTGAGIPLLRDIFLPPGEGAERPSITLGTLARSLGVAVGRLVPLVREGWIELSQSGPTSHLDGLSYVVMPPESAVEWMKGWFAPVASKSLFSLADVSELLGASAKDCLRMAAAYCIPVSYDAALGHVLSMWATQQLLRASLSGKPDQPEAQRWDRQALLWRILEGDPARLVTLPTFNQSLEQELERVCRLEEPARTTRVTRLLENFLDVKQVAETIGLTTEVADKAIETIRRGG